jgi:hypothetical protein
MQFLIRFAVLFRQYVDATWKVTVGPSIIRRDGDIHGYLRSISLAKMRTSRVEVRRGGDR